MSGSIAISCAGTPATQAVAAALAGALKAGDVVLLTGELGAGKTTFVQGLARSLGVDDEVTSPTFTLLRPYPTARGFDLLHADLYRLESVAEIADLGMGELLDAGCAAAIEWGDRAIPVLGQDYLSVRFSMGEDIDTRSLLFEPVGPSWKARWDHLAAALVERVA